MSKKTVIIYASTHHKNTYKLVKAISDKHNVDIIDATQQSSADLQGPVKIYAQNCLQAPAE